MPISAEELSKALFMRVLLMGTAKAGKTQSTIASLAKAFGPGYVVCCGDPQSLEPALRETKKFTYDAVKDEITMDAALKEARGGVREKRYNWVVVDDYSLYGSWLEDTLRTKSAEQSEKGEPDGRRYWPEYKSRVLNICRRAFEFKAHLVFISHFIEPSTEIKGQRAKSGPGVIPMFGGTVREELPAMFQDILFLEKEKGGRRVLLVNPDGVWGLGSRSVPGTQIIDADFGVFWKLAQGEGLEEKPVLKAVKK